MFFFKVRVFDARIANTIIYLSCSFRLLYLAFGASSIFFEIPLVINLTEIELFKLSELYYRKNIKLMIVKR